MFLLIKILWSHFINFFLFGTWLNANQKDYSKGMTSLESVQQLNYNQNMIEWGTFEGL